MSKHVLDMDHDEFVDWAAGYVLQQLIAGEFRKGIYVIIDWASQRGAKTAKKAAKA